MIINMVFTIYKRFSFNLNKTEMLLSQALVVERNKMVKDFEDIW